MNALGKISAIALNTFREAVRDRVLAPDEAAFLRGWSSGETVARAIKKLGKTAYGSMLRTLVDSAAAQTEAA